MMNRIQKQVSLFFSSVLLACSSLSAFETPSYETYLTSWDPNFQQIAEAILLPGFESGQLVVINIAFGDFTFQEDFDGIVIGGVPIPMQTLLETVGVLRDKGYFVKMSFGGQGCKVSSILQSETDATNLANSISQAVQAYGFDGVDLDIEDWDVDPDLEISMIAQLRENLGDRPIISLTVPGNAFFSPVQDAISGAKKYVNYFNFMEYGITLENGNTFSEQVLQNLNTYLSTFELGLDQMNLGLSPVNGDPSSYISVDDLPALMKDVFRDPVLPLYTRGMMLWSLDLDVQRQLGNEIAPGQYSAIMALETPAPQDSSCD